METFLFIALIGVVIWLVSRHNQLVDRLAHTERQLLQVYARLKSIEVQQAKETVATKPAENTVPPEPRAPIAEEEAESSRPAGAPVVESSAESRVPESEMVAAKELTGLREPAATESGPAAPERVSSGFAGDSEGRSETRTPRKAAPPPLPKDAVTAAAVVDEEWSLRPLLQKLNLMPPTGETAEAALASWWLTRIGLVVLVIAAVFFGVRIAADVPPVVRLVTVGGIAVAMTWFGVWLERRTAEFGRLVSAGGLALGYFTAFAAYGIEPMKVIENPAMGFFLQAVAAAGIIAWSMWKNDVRVATMGVLLGYVACWFSHAHDLDHFVVLGLLVLAAGAGIVQITRRWLVPMGVATLGSWGGFAILATQDWPRLEVVPSLAFILTCLLGLMVLLEAISFTGEDRSRDEDHGTARKRHWLAILNTSLAALVTWLAVRLAYPGSAETTELDVTYLALALGVGAFAALRFWRNHSVNLSQAYFLKASALLALFVVEAFDGPTRWLSLSIQTLVLLWAYRQSGLRWIEVGFAVLFACTLATIGHDALHLSGWTLLGVANVIGAISMVILSVSMALHARWYPGEALQGQSETVDGPRVDSDLASSLRFLGCLGLGAVAILLAHPGVFALPSAEGVVFLSVLAILLGLPAIMWRQVPPVVAGLLALGGAVAGYAFSREAGGVGTGLWLTLLGFGLSEVARRLWKNDWALGHGARMILHSVGATALAVMLARVMPEGQSVNALAMMGFAGAGVWALARQSRGFPANPGPEKSEAVVVWQWALSGGIGLLAFYLGIDVLEGLRFGPSWLAVAGGGLFAAAMVTRNSVPALAGGIPLVASVVLHPLKFGATSAVPDHLMAALLIVAVCSTTAASLWRKVDAREFRAAIGFDAVLHILALLVLHWFFRSHLSSAATLFADAATALGVVLIHLRFPLPTLNLVSAVPLLLGGLRIETASISGVAGGAEVWWTLSAGIILAWLIAQVLVLRKAGDRAAAVTGQRGALRIHGGIAALLLTMAGLRAAPEPWEMAVLALFGALLLMVGRWGKLATLHLLSVVPLGVGLWKAVQRVPGWGDPPEFTLVALAVTMGLLVLHGVMLCWKQRDRHGLAWAHGLLVLLILLPAFPSVRIGVPDYATVCWGLTAIGLFITGLVAGIRPFRLAGLLGLACAILRMFMVDIDDGFVRIIAFAGIAVVLLFMGYLYNRFRHLIDGKDDAPS